VDLIVDAVAVSIHLGGAILAKEPSMISTQNSRLIGYARVSTNDQELNLQVDALLAHGVIKEHLFFDKLSGAREDRPGLLACNEVLRRGDTLVVWRLDRLGRSMRHLVNLIEDLKERGIGFRSISDGMIDTTSASGELVLNIFSALAQFERRLIQERTKAGLAAARARGRKGGRPPMDRNQPRVILANKLFCDRSVCIDDICATLKISRSTLYRYVSMHGNRHVRS
jgi:DNA invertase Pin-like site-specific DNA recombinase